MGTRHRRRDHRFRHRQSHGARRPHRRQRGLHGPAATGQATSTATARTSRASSPRARRSNDTGEAPVGHGAGRAHRQPEGAGRRRHAARPATRSRRIDWAIDQRAAVQHPHHQPVARHGADAVVARRPAVPGRRARGRARASSSWRRPATTARRTDGKLVLGSVTSPGISPLRDHGRRAADAGHGRPVRRRTWRRGARRGRR